MKTKKMSGNKKIQIQQLLANAIQDTLFSRASLMSRLGKSYSGERDLYKALGYVANPIFSDFYSRYTRGDIAKTIVNAYPNACWAEPPEISEDDKEETEFEAAWKSLVKKRKVFQYLLRADKLAGIGRYSVLLFGFDDGLELSEPVISATGLMYLQTYMQSSVCIDKYILDSKNERFGLPEVYQISTSIGNDSQTIIKHVSHTRILHIAEDVLENEIDGTPKLECILNRLQDVETIVGSSSEMFFRGGFPGFAFKTQEGAMLDPEQDTAGLEEEINNYIHGFQRIMKLQGIDIQELSGSAVDPTGHLSVQLDLISGASGIPKRILIGSERGELASTQDETSWVSRVDQRRKNHCEPNILRPFIDRLIEYGVLPEPANEYTVKWPDVYKSTEQEKAGVALTKTQAITAYANSAGADQIIPPDEFLKIIMELSDEEIQVISEKVVGIIQQEQDQIKIDQQNQLKLAKAQGIPNQLPGNLPQA